MKISTILDHIDSGHISLPEFQRGYVWNSDQVRGFFDSLYKRHPVGGLLVWVTETQSATHRGDGPLSKGVVKLLLDGQQRMTSLYGVVRGHPPKFFDGDQRAFKGLRFNLESETFSFYQPVKMKDDPLWIDVTRLMSKGQEGHEELIEELSSYEDIGPVKAAKYSGKISRLLGILDVDLHIEEVTGEDKTLEIVVDIFNRVNSGGTKLSKGDLALAKICSDWSDARDIMKDKLKEWKDSGYEFNLDWLLRCLNTVLTGEAKFHHLHNKSAEEIEDGLKRACNHINKCLNMISGRLGLDHDRVLFSRFALPVMVHYLDRHDGKLSNKERDKLLFWFMQTGMWGRFSGSTESSIDKDIDLISGEENDLDQLLEQLRLSHGGLRVEPDHFKGWSLGARFYPVLYWLTRAGEALDWGTGLPLKADLLGKMNRLEVHHIFPKSQLYKRNFRKQEVNTLANFCFLTKETNLNIRARLPEEYFPEIEEQHPGALASQWIPDDPGLWKIENFNDFIEERKRLLAKEATRRLSELLHEDTQWIDRDRPAAVATEPTGSMVDTDEEDQLEAFNMWMEEQGLPRGIISYEYTDPDTGEPKAILDLAWPDGIQEELSQPVAVVLDQSPDVPALASQGGFRCFTSVKDLENHVRREYLAEVTS